MIWRTQLLVFAVGCSSSTGPGAGKATSPGGDTADSGGADSGSGGGSSTWRSSLYPLDWSPGFSTEDGQLRDFSTAGYRASEVPLPSPSSEEALNVLDFGADATASADSTTAFQAAFDAADSLDGAVVIYVPEGLYRIDGLLRVERSHTVVLGDGADRSQLWFTAAEGADHSAHLLFRGAPAATLSAELLADTTMEADRVQVAEGSGLVPGDEVWVGITITDDFIADHSMEGYWTFSAGAWRPFFRRTVVDVVPNGDGAEAIVLDVTLPYPLTTRDNARIERVEGYLEEVGIVGIGVSNALDWDTAWSRSQVHAVGFDGVRDGYMVDLRSFETPDQPGYHLQSSGLMVRSSRRVTVADTHLGYSQHRGEGGNGYLFEIRVSNGVLVRDSTAVAGRHNFIQNWDFGASDLVFLRTHSEGAETFTSSTDTRGSTGCSETHHALAIAVLVDQSTVSDCWKMVNRLAWSSGAGHTATESVFWNLTGEGVLTSYQFGRGYIVGTDLSEVVTEVYDIYESFASAPEDLHEGAGQAATLEPPSLFEDQLARRLSR